MIIILDFIFSKIGYKEILELNVNISLYPQGNPILSNDSKISTYCNTVFATITALCTSSVYYVHYAVILV